LRINLERPSPCCVKEEKIQARNPVGKGHKEKIWRVVGEKRNKSTSGGSNFTGELEAEESSRGQVDLEKKAKGSTGGKGGGDDSHQVKSSDEARPPRPEGESFIKMTT